MKFRSIKYYLGEAARSIIRNRLMSVTSVLTVAACIFIVVFSFCIMENISCLMEQLENSIGISVFPGDNLTAQEVTDLRERILAIEHVEQVEYVSPDEALESFSDMLGDSNGLLSGFENDNPLPRSFTITLDSSRNQDGVISALEAMKGVGVDSVSHARETTNALISISNVISAAGILIIGILGACSVVIIMNTVKLTVNNRRNEITIMKYVGATDWFIKWPFVIEGILIGLIGAAVPVTICAVGYDRAIEAIYGNLSFLESIVSFLGASDIFPALAPASLGLGALIGVTGSLTSMRKHLDV